MTLESIGKLRRCADYAPVYSGASDALRHAYDKPTDYYALEAACDEIEREVAERYMELPLDADGVPIHVGDELARVVNVTDGGRRSTVEAVSKDAFITENDKYHLLRTPYCYRHVQPDTWERIVADAVAYGYVSDGGDGDDGFVRGLVSRCEALAGEAV